MEMHKQIKESQKRTQEIYKRIEIINKRTKEVYMQIDEANKLKLQLVTKSFILFN